VQVQYSLKYLSSFAVTGNGHLFVTSNDGIYRSINNGLNWNLIFATPTGTTNYCLAAKDSVIFLGTSGWMYRSINNGVNWTQLINGESSRAILLLDNYVFSNTKRSTDNGETWISITNGLPPFSFAAKSLANSGNILYMGLSSQSGVYTSSNYGDNWSKLENIIQGYAYSIHTINQTILVGAADGVYFSTNGGSNWQLINGIFGNIGLFGFANYTSQNIFICGWTDSVYRSTNYGNNWKSKMEGIIDNTFNGMFYYNNYVYCGTSDIIYRRNVSELIPVLEQSEIIPEMYRLEQNYPNPFNPITNFKFSILNSGQVKLIVYDIMGREVKTLVNETLKPGRYEASFDGSMLNSGVYFYKLTSDRYTETRKMLLIK
jgi:photosystem II stability/assembly factor-like uncharacterized protein